MFKAFSKLLGISIIYTGILEGLLFLGLYLIRKLDEKYQTVAQAIWVTMCMAIVVIANRRIIPPLYQKFSPLLPKWYNTLWRGQALAFGIRLPR